MTPRSDSSTTLARREQIGVASRRVARVRSVIDARARAEIRTNFWLVTTQPDLVAEIDFVARDVETRAASRTGNTLWVLESILGVVES